MSGLLLAVFTTSRAQDALDILDYNVQLVVEPELNEIRGNARLEISAQQRLDEFSLDLVQLNVDSVFVNDRPAPFFRDDRHLVIEVDVNAGDQMAVRIVYHGDPGRTQTGGFFWGEDYHYTMGEGIDVQDPSMLKYWIPCNDIPSDKATFALHVTVPDDLWALSNGDLVEITPNVTKETLEYHWTSSVPIATYLVALTIGPYVSFQDSYPSVSGTTIPIVNYVFPRDLEKAQFDWSIVPDVMAVFEHLFGPYPFGGYGMVQIPGGGGAMEHQTLSSFYENLVTGDRRFEYIVVHELAHQWWGNWVTLTDWREIWLNEGFASYSEALYAEARRGDSALAEVMRTFKNAYMSDVGRRGHFSIYDPEYAWGSTVYRKGAWVLHMLRWVTGDDVFFSILKEYGRQFAYSNATLNDFIDVAEQQSGMDLDWFFTQWIYGEGFPVFDLYWNYTRVSEDQYDVSFRVEQSQTTPTRFYMPIEFMITTSLDSKVDTVWVSEEGGRFNWILRGKPLKLMVDPNNWVLKDINVRSEPLPGNLPPDQIALTQNYPNPFLADRHANTRILYRIEPDRVPALVRLEVYDVMGRRVRTLVRQRKMAGYHRIEWNGLDDQGRQLPSGVYVYRLQLEGQSLEKKMILLRP
jgi:aminopeptidase N